MYESWTIKVTLKPWRLTGHANQYERIREDNLLKQDLLNQRYSSTYLQMLCLELKKMVYSYCHTVENRKIELEFCRQCD